MSDANSRSHEGPWHDLTRRVRLLTGGLIVLGLVWVGTVAWLLLGFAPANHQDVLSVERLEIVEPDGQLAFVLANSARPAPATIGGEILLAGQEEERRNPSIIFFDGKGDEVGGMMFANEQTDEGFRAIRHFAMDGYRQDETVVLRHVQDPRGASSGLRVSDRPQDRSLPEVLAGMGLPPGPTRDEVNAAVQRLRDEGREQDLREFFGVTRVFLGSDWDNEATLVLRDGRERPRIVLGVPADGEPFIRVLDEQGEVLTEWPE